MTHLSAMTIAQFTLRQFPQYVSGRVHARMLDQLPTAVTVNESSQKEICAWLSARKNFGKSLCLNTGLNRGPYHIAEGVRVIRSTTELLRLTACCWNNPSFVVSITLLHTPKDVRFIPFHRQLLIVGILVIDGLAVTSWYVGNNELLSESQRRAGFCQGTSTRWSIYKWLHPADHSFQLILSTLMGNVVQRQDIRWWKSLRIIGGCLRTCTSRSRSLYHASMSVYR